MLDPILIGPKVFAEGQQSLAGVLTLAELDERVWTHEYLLNKQSTVSFRLQGGRDRLQRLFLDLNVSGKIQLECQRCVEPLSFELDENSRIVLFVDEESLDEAMLASDELEGMLLLKELDVRTLVEDQILMALPFSPRHEDCSNAVLAKVNQDNPNPFAALAGLKTSR